MGTIGNEPPSAVRWGLYHTDRESARERGDPRLGEVTARTKVEAERKARRRGIAGPTGNWAHPMRGGC